MAVGPRSFAMGNPVIPSCQILHHTIAAVVHTIFLFLVFGVLFTKRAMCDRRKRPIKVWSADILKQGCGHVVVALINLQLHPSARLQNSGVELSECARYVVGYVAIACGVMVITPFLFYGAMRLVMLRCGRVYFKSLLISGRYGSDSSSPATAVDFITWSKQTLFWCALMGVARLFIELLSFFPPLIALCVRVGVMVDNAFVWSPNQELVFTLLAGPLLARMCEWVVLDAVMARNTASTFSHTHPNPFLPPGKEEEEEEPLLMGVPSRIGYDYNAGTFS